MYGSDASRWAAPLVLLGAPFLGIVLTAGPAHAQDAESELVRRGRYVFQLAGTCGCHSDTGVFLGGGHEFRGPFGRIYASNITRDREMLPRGR